MTSCVYTKHKIYICSLHCI